MDSDFLTRITQSLEEVDLCAGLAHTLSDGEGSDGEEDEQLEREIDQLTQRFVELKEEEASVVANLEARLKVVAKCRRRLVAARVSALAAAATTPSPKGALESSGTVAAGTGPPTLCTNFVAYLSEEEFEHLPKHTKGRHTLAALNQLVDAFNLALVKKYALMGLPKDCLDATQQNKVTAYKKLETVDTRNLRFLTDGDLTTRAFRSAREIASFVLVMRHCGRIREIRGPERILRYAVI